MNSKYSGNTRRLTPASSESPFLQRLSSTAPDPANTGDREWFYLPYDQLSTEIGPVAELRPEAAGLVLVESTWKPRRRPYHKQKLAMILANQRQFALEAQAKGFAVRYIISHAPYSEALTQGAADLGQLTVMEPAERELRHDLAPLIDEGTLLQVPHGGWLTQPDQFDSWCGAGPPWRMDRFYREARRTTGLLMESGKPSGGRFSFDGDNRKSWRGTPAPPEVPTFPEDEVKREIADLVESLFPDHPGRIDLANLPSTAADAEALWEWALAECMEHFGPYEDAMTTESSGLFHTRISPLLNLHRLLPARVVADVANREEIPLASREGFVRQILGWREFVRHVHRTTDGFRTLSPTAEGPGSGNWRSEHGKSWAPSPTPDHLSSAGGAEPKPFEDEQDLPPVYWGDAPSGLHCLDSVVEDVWREGWSHHITRLMILSNLATLLDVDARQLTDWFWVAYTDAYDWVVEPNVLGMGTYALGDVMTTKPYVSGAAYIHRMSDYCSKCSFHPKKTCPITSMYWDYLARHQERFAGNHRMSLPIRSLAKRSEEQRQMDAKVRREIQSTLAQGKRLEPS